MCYRVIKEIYHIIALFTILFSIIYTSKNNYNLSERLSDWYLTPSEQYHGEDKLLFDDLMMMSALY
jgi:hypothetical protein